MINKTARPLLATVQGALGVFKTYTLCWSGKQWRDKAGHVWHMASDGTLSSEHGTALLHQWKVSKGITYEDQDRDGERRASAALQNDCDL